MSSGSHHVSRREFVTIVSGVVGSIMAALIALPGIGFILAPAIKAKKAEGWVSLGPLENYPIGIPTLFNFTRTNINGWEKTTNSYGVYVLRKNDSDIKVLTNVCTHLGCRVSWDETTELYACPCHTAHFDIEGTVADGPPPKPLPEFETRVEDGILSLFFEG
jgi:menaquinol-cytochrome c reductase iron-sulfur subunit